jgi:large subunit ribosomal protein L17
MPKIFGELRERYLNRPGGYTRVLRIEPIKEDQAPSAILELVDGPKDMRFAMTAKTLARERATEEGVRDVTAENVRKVTRYRPGGEEELEKMVKAIEGRERDERRREEGAIKKKVYPEKAHPMIGRTQREIQKEKEKREKRPIHLV